MCICMLSLYLKWNWGTCLSHGIVNALSFEYHLTFINTFYITHHDNAYNNQLICRKITSLHKPHDIRQHYITTHVVRVHSLDLLPFFPSHPYPLVQFSKRQKRSIYLPQPHVGDDARPSDRAFLIGYLVPNMRDSSIQFSTSLTIEPCQSWRDNLYFAANIKLWVKIWVFNNLLNRNQALRVTIDVCIGRVFLKRWQKKNVFFSFRKNRERKDQLEPRPSLRTNPYRNRKWGGLRNSGDK